MVDNVVGDDVEPKLAKNEAYGDALVKVPAMSNQPLIWNRLKSKFHFKLTLVKLKNLNRYLSVLFAKFTTPPHFLQQMQDRESEKSYLVGFVDKGKGPDLLFV